MLSPLPVRVSTFCSAVTSSILSGAETLPGPIMSCGSGSGVVGEAMAGTATGVDGTSD